ncbi:MAG: sigma-70 family RNA polymerase sigma factor [Acidobacteriaceae bacterium]
MEGPKPGPLPPADDAQAVALLQNGDGSGLKSLYDKYSNLVYSVALRSLGDTAAAEDVLQEVFLQLWRKPHSFDPARGSLPAWLAVLTRNRAIDARRRRRPEVDIEDVPLAGSLDLEDRAVRQALTSKARECMAGMPAEQRRDVELAFFAGMTHSEIAAKTGEPLGTVKTRIRTGLITIRRALS